MSRRSKNDLMYAFELLGKAATAYILWDSFTSTIRRREAERLKARLLAAKAASKVKK